MTKEHIESKSNQLEGALKVFGKPHTKRNAPDIQHLQDTYQRQDSCVVLQRILISPLQPVGLLYPGKAIDHAAAAAQKKSFWMLVIRWYQEVADLGQGCVNHGD